MSKLILPSDTIEGYLGIDLARVDEIRCIIYEGAKEKNLKTTAEALQMIAKDSRLSDIEKVYAGFKLWHIMQHPPLTTVLSEAEKRLGLNKGDAATLLEKIGFMRK